MLVEFQWRPCCGFVCVVVLCFCFVFLLVGFGCVCCFRWGRVGCVCVWLVGCLWFCSVFVASAGAPRSFPAVSVETRWVRRGCDREGSARQCAVSFVMVKKIHDNLRDSERASRRLKGDFIAGKRWAGKSIFFDRSLSVMVHIPARRGGGSLTGQRLTGQRWPGQSLIGQRRAGLRPCLIPRP